MPKSSSITKTTTPSGKTPRYQHGGRTYKDKADAKRAKAQKKGK